MAKSPKHETAPAEGTVVATATGTSLSDLVLTYGPHSVAYRDLPEATRVRMAQKAFNELMNDSTALSKDAKDKIVDTANDNGQDGKQALATALAEKREQRFNSLLSGNFSVVARGPKGSKIDTIIKEVATEFVRAAWDAAVVAGKVKKGTPFPKNTKAEKKLDVFIAAIMAKMGDEIKAEAERRMAKPVADVSADVLDF